MTCFRTGHRCFVIMLASVFALLACCVSLASCQNSDLADGFNTEATTGDPFVRPEIALSYYSADGGIDISGIEQGYVGASAISESRLKFQVINGAASYNYDLPGDGTPIICPLNMGDGEYTFKIMQNTSGDRYVELASSIAAYVQMESEFAAFMRPNMFCNYTESSAVVSKANELSEGAANEAEVLKNIYSWVQSNIAYDPEKAEAINNGSIGGEYVPSPDETLASKKGICFDYASLTAAMLRSQGIPCKIVTGAVSPDNIYHAWNVVYLDGSWTSAKISVNTDTWTRIDLTFAAGGASAYIGDGVSYTDRYTY